MHHEHPPRRGKNRRAHDLSARRADTRTYPSTGGTQQQPETQLQQTGVRKPRTITLTEQEIADIKKRVHCDPKTGDVAHYRYPGQYELFEPKHRQRTRPSPKSINNHGYHLISVKGRTYPRAKLIWLDTYGYWPKILDHKNGIRTDDSIENLRLATTSQNNANRKPRGKSGIKGVYPTRNGNWQAIAGSNHKPIYAGTFKHIQDAAQAYKLTAIKVHGPFARWWGTETLAETPTMPNDHNPRNQDFRHSQAFLHNLKHWRRRDHWNRFDFNYDRTRTHYRRFRLLCKQLITDYKKHRSIQ